MALIGMADTFVCFPSFIPLEPWKSLPNFYSSVKKTVVKKLVRVFLEKKEVEDKKMGAGLVFWQKR